MTNTLTTDVAATLPQINSAAEAGADIVRVSCPDEASTAALKQICRESPVPIVADIHFHYKRALEAADAGAAVCGLTRAILAQTAAEAVRAARANGCSMRIGGMAARWKNICWKNMLNPVLRRWLNQL